MSLLLGGHLQAAPIMFAPLDASFVLQIQRGRPPPPHPPAPAPHPTERPPGYDPFRPGDDGTLQSNPVTTEADVQKERQKNRDKISKDCAEAFSDRSVQKQCEEYYNR
jgi:hypothetical protein